MLPFSDTEETASLTRANKPKIENIKVLVVPVQFKDITFNKKDYKEYLQNKLNTPGYSEDGATGSAKDYFEANFLGSTFTFDVSDVVTLSKEASYYGANDETVPSRIIYDVNMPVLVREACTAVNSTVNFGDYDQNGDGKVDHLIFLYAGYNEAEGGGSDAIWSHEWDLTAKKMKFDGITVGLYAATAELRGASGHNDAGIGTFSHELAHTFGLKDLYDVNYGSEGLCKCLWQTLSLMDYGNYSNEGNTPPYWCAIDREQAGIADINNLKAGEHIQLEPVNRTGRIFRYDTETEREYFLFETRSESGWDRYIGGHGLVIYHIDKSDSIASGVQASVRWSENIINTVSGHECADLVEALPEATSIRQIFFPGQGAVTEFGPTTVPSFESWNGKSLMLRLSDIRQNGESISFTVLKDSSERLLSAIDPHVMAYQTEAEILWKSEKENAIWGIRWTPVGQTQAWKESTVRKTECRLNDLEPNTDYRAEIFNIGKKMNGDTTSILFSTLGFTSPYPVISSGRNIYKIGEAVTLKVLNIHEKTSSIKWYINGLITDTDTIILHNSGTTVIKAVITYASDGSYETITKTIKVLDDEKKD